ncbi:AraC family transcriptional regulator [Photobacterium minamisatsumaniensis]|uniref:AraC family transcriptional regulator n=1 Tax=Photobacterium minamisatsumaniensis TaxID=2910233 RepID=UPI003D0E7431
MDPLSEVLSRFSVSAGVFYSGQLCGVSQFEKKHNAVGHLHLLKTGTLTVQRAGQKLVLTEPSLLLFPKPTGHRLHASQEDHAEVVCAEVSYGAGRHSPIASALPEMVLLPLSRSPSLAGIVSSLFEEVHDCRHGRALVMDRLTEVLIVMLLRELVAQNVVTQGMLAGLSHPKIASVLLLIHQHPEITRTVPELARQAAMSRTTFIETFRQVLGVPPGDYILGWKMTIAQSMLKKGMPISYVAIEVGYSNTSGFARAFRKKTGMSPKAWVAINY